MLTSESTLSEVVKGVEGSAPGSEVKVTGSDINGGRFEIRDT